MGCAVDDPRIVGPRRSGAAQRSGPSPTSGAPLPDPSPTPTFAGAEQGATLERKAAGSVTVVLDGPWREQLGARRELLVAIRSGHLEHAAALAGAQPTARPTQPSGYVTPILPKRPTSLAAALDRLVQTEQTAADRHRTAALATTGYSALLWGSMSVAATTYASALPMREPVAIERTPALEPMPQLSDIEAMQLLVRQLHAIVYGYQLAIGQLDDGPRRTSALTRLRDHRIQLDRLTTALLARPAPVPAAEPAYVPSVNPRSDATAAQLVAAMEDALAPFCGLWLASSGNAADRRRAFSALSATVATARRFDAPVSAWPGWER
jgi:hypothetical protein